MILFDLLCSKGHRFESWFRDNDGFERLAAVGEIQCTVCGDTDVKKALMAPNVRTSKAIEIEASTGGGRTEAEPAAETATPPPTTAVVQGSEETPAKAPKPVLPPPEKLAEAMQVLRQVQTHIEKTFDHVGREFAEEARKIHYGETKKRNIYGEATKEEAEQLVDEGIKVNSMPWLPSRNS